MSLLTRLLLPASAWAADGATAAPGPVVEPYGLAQPQILMFALLIFVFYFFLFRPQQKKLNALSAMLKALKKGDRVVTGGGILGTIASLEDNDLVVVEIAPNTRVKVTRSTIAGLVDAPSPPDASKKA